MSGFFKEREFIVKVDNVFVGGIYLLEGTDNLVNELLNQVLGTDFAVCE